MQVVALTLAIAFVHASSARADEVDAADARDHAASHVSVDLAPSAKDATDAHERGVGQNLIANGSFSQPPNPLAFWTNAPGALVTWIGDGANASAGAVHLHFFPPISRGAIARGAVYYTGLTQCVSIPRSGRYLLHGFARVPATASASSLPGLGWTLRHDDPNCSGVADRSGSININRSTAWTSSSIEAIEIDASEWTGGTTLEVEVRVGDSSTASIEPVEAVLDEIALIEGPLFQDGFEGQ